MPSATLELLETEIAPPPRAPAPASIVPPLTPAAQRVLWVIAGLFLLWVGLRLNGSSIDCARSSNWPDVVLQDAPSGLLLSHARVVRSDEWMVWTPAIVSQARQTPSFPTSNLSFGPGKTPLLMSLPARHYTMLLRPQLWGYFLLPLEYGFAWNWDFKIFGLLAAMFVFFWTVTRGRLWLSVFGALSVLFSPLVQWWFSSPSMLPEMMTYWALGVTAALRIFAGLRWVNAGVLAVSLANIMLCCYPPFEIVLFHLGLFIVAGFVWQHRIFNARRLGRCLAAFLLAALALVPWVVDCYPTLQLVAHTVYPGQRQCFGGGLALARLFSGFFGLALDESTMPGILLNVSEAGSFYPVWLLSVGLGCFAFVRMLLRTPASAREWLAARGLKVMLVAYLLLAVMFALVQFPAWLCRATLLSRTIEVRWLAGMGLAGTLLVVLSLASLPKARASGKMAMIAGAAWSLGVLTFLISQGPSLTLRSGTPFLLDSRWIEVGAAAALFGLVYLSIPSRWAVVLLLGPFIVKTALVNPVCVGLPELLRSPALNTVHDAVQREPAAQWAFYGTFFGVEALKSAGAPVVDGVRVIPDPDLIHILDPAGKGTAAYNRYAHLVFDQKHPASEVSVQLGQKVFCVVEISPARVLELFPKVKYIAAAKPLPSIEAAGLQLWKDWPEDHLWIYRLPGD